MLKPTLDRLYDELQLRGLGDRSDSDRPALRAPDDREVVAFCAAALAFGRVASVLQSIERLVGDHGRSAGRLRPAVRSAARRARPSRASCTGGRAERDLVALVWVIRQMLDRSGSIEGFFLEGLRRSRAPTSPAALDSFSDARDGARSASARTARVPEAARASAISFRGPSKGSACKRLNLFLRWMVRRDALDLGVWTRVLGRRSWSCRSTRTSFASAAACG